MQEPLILPYSWFRKQQQKDSTEIAETWESQISIAANKTFEKFSFINQNKRTYLAFTRSSYDNKYKETKIIYPRKSYASHARNQTTKDQLYFVQKVKNEGSTLTLIYDHQFSKSIHFELDHFNCSPDILHNIQADGYSKPDEINNSDNIMLQAVTVTQDDQNIHLQTTYIEENHIQTVDRITKLQIVSA